MVTQLCISLSFPPEAVKTLSRWNEIITGNEKWNRMLQESIADYLADGQTHLDMTQTLADQLGASVYEVHLVLLLHCALDLRKAYAEKGLSDELYLETMQDLRCKLMECYRLHGVWGNGVLAWNRRFFRMERFQLGRLQFEVKPWTGLGYEDYLIEGQDAYWCHIPSSGPCTPEMVRNSLKRAYAFYQRQGIWAVGCKSWMLYPPHFPLFKTGGNLDAFRRCFQVFHQVDREDNHDLWRIFGVDNETPLPLLPEETSLQRSFAPWLRQGNKMGTGVGVLLFDGENILTYKNQEE